MRRNSGLRRRSFVSGRTYYLRVRPYIALLKRTVPATSAVSTNHSCDFRREHDAFSPQAGVDRPHGVDPRLLTHLNAKHIGEDRCRWAGAILIVLSASFGLFR